MGPIFKISGFQLPLTDMKGLCFIGIILCLGLAECRSPFFSQETVEVESSEHGGPAGKVGTTCECGWANKGAKRIVGGKETKINEYPWVVALADRMGQFCGGTILTNKHVLTAAHCTVDYSPTGGDISVIVGEHDLTTNGETKASESYRVRIIYQHDDYNDFTMENDISLLFLESSIQFSKLVGPACVPTYQMNLEKQYVRVIGWGQTSQTSRGSNVLKKVDLRVVPLRDCSKNYRNINPYMRKQICTHGQQKGPCMGDSGGPLVWVDPDTNRYTVVGLVSFGRICGSKDPSVYTDVASYLYWIRTTIKRSSAEPLCTKK